jgi:hypothetical protein
VQITIDLTTLLAVGGALSLAGTAALWAFRRYDELQRIPLLWKRVEGDEQSPDPKIRDGLARRFDDCEAAVAGHAKLLRAFARAMRIPPTSDEHEIVEAIRLAIAEGRVSGVEPTGSHRAIVVEALPAPAQLQRHPTPYRGAPIPREEPDDGPKRKR